MILSESGSAIVKSQVKVLGWLIAEFSTGFI